MTQQTTGSKKPKPTAKERWEQLEEKKEKAVQEYAHLFARVDACRLKINKIDAECRDAYKDYLRELKNK